jgi:hypothetical protein
MNSASQLRHVLLHGCHQPYSGYTRKAGARFQMNLNPQQLTDLENFLNAL